MWERVTAMCATLAEDVLRSGYHPTHIIAVARGGWVPALLIAQLVEPAELLSISVRYSGATGCDPAPVPPVPEVPMGGRALILEDFVESGRSLRAARGAVLSSDNSVRTAALARKPSAVFVPDYCLATSADAPWFPWEIKRLGR